MTTEASQNDSLPWGWIAGHGALRLAFLACATILLPQNGDFSDDSYMWLSIAESPWVHLVAPRFAHHPPLVGFLLTPVALLAEVMRPEMALRVFFTLVEFATFLFVSRSAEWQHRRTATLAAIALGPLAWYAVPLMAQDETLALAAAVGVVTLCRRGKHWAAVCLCSVSCVAVKHHFLIPLAALLLVHENRTERLKTWAMGSIPFVYYAALALHLVPGHSQAGSFETVGWFSVNHFGPLLFEIREGSRGVIHSASNWLTAILTLATLQLMKKRYVRLPAREAFVLLSFAGLLVVFSMHYVFPLEYMMILLPFAATLLPRRAWWVLVLAPCLPLATKFLFAARYAQAFNSDALNGQILSYLEALPLAALHHLCGWLTLALFLWGLVWVLRNNGPHPTSS